jgi:fructuronate reductase
MHDKALAAFVKSLMLEDIAPTVRPPKGLDTGAYVDGILARFRNPAVRHLLSQIAWDGSQKLPFRLMDTIADNLISGGRVDRLCLAVAAWMHFTRRQVDAGRPLVDPLSSAIARCSGVRADAATEVAQYLTLTEVFPAALTGNDEFRSHLTDAYASLR